jgi:hypothetical protein
MYSLRTMLFAFFISVIATVTLARAAPQSGESAVQTRTAPVTEDTRQVLFTMSDAAGNPAPDPTINSVRLSIDKRPVEIQEVRPLKNNPLFFSVLVDVSGSSKQFADQQIAAASRLFGYLGTGNNHGYLILFKSEIASTDRFIGGSSVEETLKRFPLQARSGGTALYDAIIHAATEQLSSTKIPVDSRRALFILSDGADNTSHKSLKQTLKLVRNEDIPVFSIGFSRYQGADLSRSGKLELEVLKTLSNSTGGSVTFLDQPGDPVRLAAHLTDGECLLVFKPPALKSNKSYPMNIESTVKEIHALAPTEYFVP